MLSGYQVLQMIWRRFLIQSIYEPAGVVAGHGHYHVVCKSATCPWINGHRSIYTSTLRQRSDVREACSQETADGGARTNSLAQLQVLFVPPMKHVAARSSNSKHAAAQFICGNCFRKVIFSFRVFVWICAFGCKSPNLSSSVYVGTLSNF
jgi:hypothetical protein